MSNVKELEGGRKLAVKLGDYEYIMVPQRMGRLRVEIPKAVSGIENLEGAKGFGDLLDILGDRAYALLKIFIPELMPAWEFAGYPTQEAQASGEYREEYDKSPDPGQVQDAIAAAGKLHRMDILQSLGKLIGPDLIRAFVAGLMRQTLETRDRTSASENGSATSGDTPSTTSGMKLPTSESSADSLTLASLT